MKIKSVVTALGNPKINEELKENNINVITSDIQYQEGILEYLDKNNNINYLIIDENLPGNLKTEELIYNIKKINNKIKIILITQNERIKVYKKISTMNSEKIIKIINSENIFSKKYLPINNFFNENTKDGKIVTVLGPNGIGKSIFCITFANNLKNKKILIIDFDVLNNSLHTLLGVKQYSKKIQNNIKRNNVFDNQINILDFIISTKFNIDLISGINLILDSNYKISSTKIKNIIKKIKNNYDLIIIDTSSDCFLNYTEELIKISDSSIFISGANLLEIKKSKKLLEIYNKEWEIEKEKINIVFNKCTEQSINDGILREEFKKYNILGKIKLSDYYDFAINKNRTKIKEIQNDLEKIKNNLQKNKYLNKNKY